MKRQFALVAVILTLLGTGFTFNSWRSQVAEGNQSFKNGNIASAVQAYQQALVDAPDEPVVHYNLGSALYNQGDFAGAQEHFNKTQESKDTSLQKQAEYNLGNTLYRQGTGISEANPQGTINLYKAALQHYQNVMKADPTDQDAKYNYELVKKKLKELEDQLENQEQDSQSNDDGDSQEEDQNGSQQDNQQSGQQDEQQGSEDQQDQQEQQSGEGQEDQPQEQNGSEEQAAGAGEEGEELDGLTQAQALQLLEQFAEQVGQWIPVPMEDEQSGQPRKDW